MGHFDYAQHRGAHGGGSGPDDTRRLGKCGSFQFRRALFGIRKPGLHSAGVGCGHGGGDGPDGAQCICGGRGLQPRWAVAGNSEWEGSVHMGGGYNGGSGPDSARWLGKGRGLQPRRTVSGDGKR